MRMTLKEKEALKESIEHWFKDIYERFLKGDRVVETGFRDIWESDGSVVKDRWKDCALCELHKENVVKEIFVITCKKCVYSRKYKVPCDHDARGMWKAWRRNLNMAACEDMIIALIDLLPVKERPEYYKRIVGFKKSMSFEK